MHVVCKSKNCGAQIPIAGRPEGSTGLDNVRVQGNVNVSGGKVSFGPGGKVSFGPGGMIAFGPPKPSQFVCPECGHVDLYHPDEFLD